MNKISIREKLRDYKFYPILKFIYRRIMDLRIEKVVYYSRLRAYPYRGYEALHYVLKNYSFETVLDVGCGEGIQSDIFLSAGKKVTAIDYGKSYFYDRNKNNPQIECIIGNVNEMTFGEKKFDVVWCCHVLEHQINANQFLQKLNSFLKEGGILAITVPPYKRTIVGGHVSLWNAGLLIYNLILAGFDCSDAHIKTYDYDVSVVVKKKSINVLEDVAYCMGDLKILSKYFPKGLKYKPTEYDTSFNGNIKELNWTK